MLISPPFLPTRLANESEDDWINRCMTGDAPGLGNFPVSHHLGWHGGLHLTAPAGANGAVEPVRAIADGTVVAWRAPSPQPSGQLPPNHPQVSIHGWTDNGMVMLRHDTEIGDGAQARVTFYSIVMHLRALDPRIKPGKAIYRKDVLGEAGQIDGSLQRQIHFEIVCDDTNVARLAGRASGPLSTGTDGRSDVVFGEMYGLLKPNFKAYAHKPPAHEPAPQKLSPQLIATACVVGLRYAGGEGPAGRRGDLTITTYHLDGSVVGQPLVERNAEYELYTQATAISRAYPQGAQPAPSAVYELLRFGRVINTAHETLSPADVPHWREIALPGGGTGWVNLNAADVRQFSDADFPDWKGWRLVDDASDGDSRCNSALIRGWLDIDGDRTVSPAEAQARLGQPQVAQRLARTICKFPTDWDASTVDTRWGWLKTATAENPTPFKPEEFAKLKQHIGALAFWTADIGLPAVHWHWEPREFVRGWRTCTWLSAGELAQTLPRRRPTILSWADAHQRAQAASSSINVMARKYLGHARNRLSHALAQIFIETDLLATMVEYSAGRGHAYGPFFGRGLMQLTWPKNYAAYGAYRNLPPHVGAYNDARVGPQTLHTWETSGSSQRWAPRFDPHRIAADQFASGDSGGFYWASKTFRGTRAINRVCDLGPYAHVVGYISWLVNGGSNGYPDRQLFFAYVSNQLLDEPRRGGVQSWAYASLASNLTSKFPPNTVPSSLTIQVNYEKQVP